MAERRISYAKDKADLIKRLVADEDGTGPFRLIADVLVFAAALGLKRGKSVPLGEAQAEPIRQEVFDRQGYDTMMNLLALHVTKDMEVLGTSDAMTQKRAQIFEEYANGVLEILGAELRGALNVLETTVLLVNAERAAPKTTLDTFDLAELA